MNYAHLWRKVCYESGHPQIYILRLTVSVSCYPKLQTSRQQYFYIWTN